MAQFFCCGSDESFPLTSDVQSVSIRGHSNALNLVANHTNSLRSFEADMLHARGELIPSVQKLVTNNEKLSRVHFKIAMAHNEEEERREVDARTNSLIFEFIAIVSQCPLLQQLELSYRSGETRLSSLTPVASSVRNAVSQRLCFRRANVRITSIDF